MVLTMLMIDEALMMGSLLGISRIERLWRGKKISRFRFVHSEGARLSMFLTARAGSA